MIQVLHFVVSQSMVTLEASVRVKERVICACVAKVDCSTTFA